MERKISITQIRAAHTLHKNGMDLTELSKKAWKGLGYWNQGECRVAFINAFKYYGLEIYDWPKLCSGCGIAQDKRTHACQTCTKRHAGRKKRGQSYIKPKKVCKECHVPYDEFTKGCDMCNQRRWVRAKRAKKRAKLSGVV